MKLNNDLKRFLDCLIVLFGEHDYEWFEKNVLCDMEPVKLHDKNVYRTNLHINFYWQCIYEKCGQGGKDVCGIYSAYFPQKGSIYSKKEDCIFINDTPFRFYIK